jgi:hypothetical protein
MLTPLLRVEKEYNLVFQFEQLAKKNEKLLDWKKRQI